MKELGYNYRLTDFQSALGISQLKKLNIFLKKRRMIAKIYNKYFSKNENFIIPPVEPSSEHGYHLYPLQINFKKLKISKNLFLKKMKKENINLQCHYMPIYHHSYYKKNFNFNKNEFKNCIDFYKNEISIPIYYGLTDNQINFIVKNILEINKLK